MLKFLKNSYRLPTFFLVSTSVFGQSPTMVLEKPVPKGPKPWTLGLALGVLEFQNIVIPTEDEKLPLVTQQRGIPLAMKAGVSLGDGPLQFHTSAEYLRALTIFGRTPGQRSTPTFVQSRLRETLQWQLGSVAIGGGLQVNRNENRDGSYRHTVDSVAPVVTGQWRPTSTWTLNADAFYSFYSRVGFSDGFAWRPKAVAGAKADHQGASLRSSSRFGQSSLFQLTVLYETSNLELPSQDPYVEYGFISRPLFDQPRAVALQNFGILIGIEKQL